MPFGGAGGGGPVSGAVVWRENISQTAPDCYINRTGSLPKTSNPPASSLVDNFDDNSIDPAKWGASGAFYPVWATTGCTDNEANQRSEIKLGASIQCAFQRISLGVYNIVDDAIFVRLLNMGSLQVGECVILAFGNPGVSFALNIFDDGTNTLDWPGNSTGGTAITKADGTWIRLRHQRSDNTIRIDSAPPSASNPPIATDWVNKLSVAYDGSVPLGAVKIAFGVRSQFTGSPAAPTTILFDGLNTTSILIVTAANLATGSPGLDTPALTQTHILACAGLATGSPGLATPTLTQKHALSTSDLVTASPGLASPVLTQLHNLSASALATGSPALGNPSITQVHVVAASALAMASPALGSPILTQLHTLVASSFAAGSPGLPTPILTQLHSLSANGLTTASPGLDTPTLTQKHVLSATNLATASPDLPTPLLTVIGAFTVNNLVTGSPAFGSPALTQLHVIATQSLATTAPGLPSPILTQRHILAANDNATGPPVIGLPVLSQIHDLVAVNLATAPPQFATPTLLAGVRERLTLAVY